MDDRQLKTCPDCAEQVLAAARKCRYCGYRFDGGGGQPAPDRANPWAKLLGSWARRPTPTRTSDLVAGWGVELDPGEDVTLLAFGRVNRRHGYLIVTEQRFAFVEHQGSQRYRKLIEWPRDRLVEVQLTGGARRRLQVRGQGFELEVGGLTREMAQRARDSLLPSE